MTREVKCKDGWTVSMRLISTSAWAFVRTMESDSWCSVLFLCVLNWCHYAQHRHLLEVLSVCEAATPPHWAAQGKAPITELTVYFTFQQSVLFISVFTVLMGGAHHQEDLRSTERRVVKINHLQSEESHRSFSLTLTVSFSLWPLVWWHYSGVQ